MRCQYYCDAILCVGLFALFFLGLLVFFLLFFFCVVFFFQLLFFSCCCFLVLKRCDWTESIQDRDFWKIIMEQAWTRSTFSDGMPWFLMYAKPTVLNAFCNSLASCCMLFSEKQSLSAGSMQTWPKSMIGIRDSMGWITWILHYPALWTSREDGLPPSFPYMPPMPPFLPPSWTGIVVRPQ